MICKWCGASVEKNSTKCLRCGRELPALSNCGGFFDLVPDAKNKISGGHSNGIGDEGRKRSGESDAMPSIDNRASKYNKRLFLVSCVSFAVIIALLLTIAVKVGRLTNAVVFEEDDLSIYVAFEETKENVSLKTSAQVDKISVPVVNKATFDKNKNIFASMVFDVADKDECFNLAITKADNESKAGAQSVSVQFDIDESVFCKSEEEEYSWSYRTSRDADWQSLDESVFSLSEDGKTIDYEIAAVKEMCQSSDVVELQLTYSRNNENGGSLKVVISGVLIAQNTAR